MSEDRNDTKPERSANPAFSLETVPDILLRIERSGSSPARIVFITGAVEKITGYRPGEFLADPGLFLKIIHTGNRQAAEAFVDLSIRAWPMPVQLRITRKDRVSRWLEINASFGRDGNRGFLDCIARDVTERRQWEITLKENERRYRTLLTHSHLYALFLDVEGRVRFAGDSLYEAAGLTRDEVLDKDFAEVFVPPSDRAAVREFIDRVVRERTVDFRERGVIRGAAGGRRHVIWSGTVMLGANFEAVGLAAMGEDITERLEAQQALEASEARYRTLVEYISDLVWVASPEMDLYYVGPTAQSLCGLPPDELMRLGWGRVLTKESHGEMQRLIEAERRKPRVVGQEVPPQTVLLDIARPDGGRRIAETKISLIIGPTGRLDQVVGVSRDVTDRVAAERALVEKERALELRNREIEGLYNLLVAVLDVQDGDILVADRGGEVRITHSRKPGAGLNALRGRRLGEILQGGEDEARKLLTETAARGQAERRVALLQPDGSFVAADCSATQLQGADGAPVGVLLIFRAVGGR